MEVKCPTCGYNVKDSTVCPRCRTKLFDCMQCSGNCFTCPSHNASSKGNNDKKK